VLTTLPPFREFGEACELRADAAEEPATLELDDFVAGLISATELVCTGAV
jgi:hypothetical protein